MFEIKTARIAIILKHFELLLGLLSLLLLLVCSPFESLDALTSKVGLWRIDSKYFVAGHKFKSKLY